MRKTISALVKAAPTLTGIEKNRFGRRILDYTAIARLADHLVEDLSNGQSGELAAVLAQAERIVSTGDLAAIEVVGTGLVEGLHNCVSHLTAEDENQVVDLLPVHCAALWNQVRSLHQEVAAWLVHSGGSAETPPPSLFESETPIALRSYARSSYWSGPSGTYVGLPDILEFQFTTATTIDG